MTAPAKFDDAWRREKAIQALGLGASLRTAAALAEVDVATLHQWLKRGSEEDIGAYHDFYVEVEKGKAEVRLRAIGVVQAAIDGNSSLAMKFLERFEEGWAPQLPVTPAKKDSPVVINLRFNGGSDPADAGPTIIDVGQPEDEGARALGSGSS